MTRCKSSHSVPGHTYWCVLTAGHTGYCTESGVRWEVGVSGVSYAYRVVNPAASVPATPLTDKQWLASLRWALSDIRRVWFRSPEPATGAKDTYALLAKLEKHLRDTAEPPATGVEAAAALAEAGYLPTGTGVYSPRTSHPADKQPPSQPPVTDEQCATVHSATGQRCFFRAVCGEALCAECLRHARNEEQDWH